MDKRLKLALGVAVLSGALALVGCASPNDHEPMDHSPHSDDHHDSGHADEHDHPADGGPVPEGMVEAANPEYPVGTTVILTADHMPGMEGVTATIVGAYDTFTYSVDYVPTDGGDPITDHKWVVQEEIEDAGDERLPDGSEVILLAGHMHGMEGAAATIAYSTDETVYVVDFEVDGMAMTNHKWVVESEIEQAVS